MWTHGSNSDCRLYNNSLASALGGACVMGTNTMALIQTCQIQAIMTVPHRLSFSAQLTNCKVGTCWHVELIISLHTQPSPSFFHWENWFSSSSNTCVIAFRVALGESLATQKNANNYYTYSSPCVAKLVRNKDAVRYRRCLSLHCWQTAMLAHVGTLNAARSAFSTFHTTFIRAIAFVVLWSSFLGWPWANLGRCLRNDRKTLMSTKACFCGKAFLGKPATITFGENKDVNSSIKFRL